MAGFLSAVKTVRGWVFDLCVSYHDRGMKFSSLLLSYQEEEAVFSILIAQTLNSGILATGSSAGMVS